MSLTACHPSEKQQGNRLKFFFAEAAAALDRTDGGGFARRAEERGGRFRPSPEADQTVVRPANGRRSSRAFSAWVYAYEIGDSI